MQQMFEDLEYPNAITRSVRLDDWLMNLIRTHFLQIAKLKRSIFRRSETHHEIGIKKIQMALKKLGGARGTRKAREPSRNLSEKWNDGIVLPAPQIAVYADSIGDCYPVPRHHDECDA